MVNLTCARCSKPYNLKATHLQFIYFIRSRPKQADPNFQSPASWPLVGFNVKPLEPSYAYYSQEDVKRRDQSEWEAGDECWELQKEGCAGDWIECVCEKVTEIVESFVQFEWETVHLKCLIFKLKDVNPAKPHSQASRNKQEMHPPAAIFGPISICSLTQVANEPITWQQPLQLPCENVIFR